MDFFEELKRRHVIRVGSAYLFGALGAVQGANALEQALELPAAFDRIATIVALGGFPIALVLAWVFDFTRAGIVRTEDGDDGDGLPTALLGAMLVASAVALGATGWWLTETNRPPAEVASARALPRSLVVLPFDDLSPARDQEHLAHGVSDELIHELSRSAALQVKGRMTGAAIKRAGLSMEEVAERTGADGVIGGSVRKAGDRLRIAVQVVSLADGQSVWTQSFERSASEVLELQSQIARAVASALEVGAQRNRAVPTSSVAAYELYLEGREFYHQLGSLERMEQAIERFEEATRIDPRFSAAHGQLAMVYSTICELGYRACALTVPRAREAALRAVELDAESDLAWQGLGQVLTREFRWPEAEEAFRKAVDLAPEAGLNHLTLGQLLDFTGRHAEALGHYEQAIERDPLNPLVLVPIANAYSGANDQTRALELTQRATQALGRRSHWIGVVESMALTRAGRLDEAAAAFATLVGAAEPPPAIARAAHSGDPAAFQQAMLEILRAASGFACTATDMTGAALLRDSGDPTGAIDCMRQAFESRSFVTSGSLFGPRNDGLRGERRFVELLEEFGLGLSEN